MRGATAPRLQLELICARVLLPAAEDAARGVAARLDRLERRAAIAGAPAEAAAPSPTPAPRPSHGGAARRRSRHAARRPPRRRPTPRRRPSPPPRPTARAGRRGRRRAGSRAGRRSPAAEPAAAPAEPAGRRAVDLVDRAAAVAGGARRGASAARLHLDPAQPQRPGGGVSDGARSRWPGQRRACATASCAAAATRIVREALVAGARRRLEGRRDRRPVGDAAPTPAAAAPPAASPRAVRAGRGRGCGGGRGGRGGRRAARRGHPVGRRRRRRRRALTHHDLLARELGAKVIGEYDAS